MRKTRLLMGLAAAVSLGGCIAGSADQLRAEAGSTVDFVANENYQAIYQRIAPVMRRCYEQAWIGDQQGVRTEVLSELRRAELSAEGQNMLLGRRVLLNVELLGAADGTTRVKAYESHSNGVAVRAVRAWVLEGYKECWKRD